jgi:hypothetical protein
MTPRRWGIARGGRVNCDHRYKCNHCFKYATSWLKWVQTRLDYSSRPEYVTGLGRSLILNFISCVIFLKDGNLIVLDLTTR